MSTANTRFIGIDGETTGLFPPEAPEPPLLVELGFQIRDAVELQVIDGIYFPIWDDGYSARLQRMREAGANGNKNVQYVVDMHDKNGLWVYAAQNGLRLAEAEAEFLAFFHEHGITAEIPIKERDPLFGSSVQFDRQCLQAFMPALHGIFHYRNIDISTVKELCQRLNPQLFGKMRELAPKQELHRVQPDLDDTFVEFEFYYDNFLWTDI